MPRPGPLPHLAHPVIIAPRGALRCAPLLALTFALTITGVACDTQGAAGTKREQKPVTVRTLPAKAENVERVVEITGTLRGAEEILISAEVEGRVEKVAADLGDAVKAGQTLIQLARETPRLQVAQADADYATALARAGTNDAGLDEAVADNVAAVRRARADAEDAARALQRSQELFEKKVTSQAELDTARTRAAVTDAALAAAHDDAAANIANAKARRAALGLAKKRLSDTSISSPVQAVVSERLVGLGELVGPAQPVMRVVQTNPLRLRGDVPERYADIVRPGLALDIAIAAQGVKVKGTVSRVGPVIDANSRTFVIEAELSNDGTLKPGSFASASVVVGDDEVVFALPETAISRVAGVTKVFVLDEGKAADRRVQVLRKRGSDALITGEIREGDHIIVTAIARLFPGAMVAVDTSAATPPAPAPSEKGAR
jgi:RND family efflux transporter MFP subunit